MRGLESRVAVIAGGGSGIGAATAVRLGEEGAFVVVGDLNGANAEYVAARINERGGTAAFVAFDIATEEGVDALIRTAVDVYGGVDCIHVNAADMSRATMGVESFEDVESVPLAVFDRAHAVDLRGHVLVTRRVVRELLARGGGVIVYTSSVCAFLGEPVRPSYAMAKSGLLALTRHVASRWGQQGIRANAITPGFVVTEKTAAHMTPELEEQYSSAKERSTRLGRPEDIAATVAFLCSTDGEWINGQTIAVDGGATMR